jgi:hypothetical protein
MPRVEVAVVAAVDLPAQVRALVVEETEGLVMLEADQVVVLTEV